jgi:hypothetical protein
MKWGSDSKLYSQNLIIIPLGLYLCFNEVQAILTEQAINKFHKLLTSYQLWLFLYLLKYHKIKKKEMISRI